MAEFVWDCETQLKALKYYCENYTIDGKSFDWRKAVKTREESEFFWWRDTPQGFDFWDCFAYLRGGYKPNHQAVKCKPWTAAEKRMIAKMPKVKR